MSVQASQYGDELRVVKGEVAEVNRLIGRLQTEIEAVKAQVSERLPPTHLLLPVSLPLNNKQLDSSFLSCPPARQPGEPAG